MTTSPGDVSAYRPEPRSLGTSNTQASPGDHTHDGFTSKKLMEGITITGSKSGNAALTSLITELSNILGFTDSTT